jgi:CopG family transcriptional regulator, nickel-responsive regulator
MALARFGVSLEKDILKELDEYVVKNSFSNRSQAIRFLIEKNLVEKKWQCNNIVTGALILVYDHHKRDISNTMADIQHDYFELILSAQHFHLSHNNCFEIIALKGPSAKLTELSDKILGIKGIIHGKLVMSKVD